MDSLKQIRFKQRFSNFEKAFSQLSKYVEIDKPTELERAGGIQFFEISFELAWKLLKDYLESEGYAIISPRAAIKQAVQADVISNGHEWLDALEDRNRTVHTYDEKTAEEIDRKIKEIYFPVLNQLYKKFKEQ